MRHSLFALPLLLLACTDPAAQHLAGFGEPVRGAAQSAPWWLGDTSRLAGQPAQAARATVQLEVVAAALREDPRYSHEASGPALHATGLGRSELRQALGIAPEAAPETVIAALREAAAALDAGRQARAEAALSGPDFRLGGAETLRRLGTLPYLPRVAEAAGAAWMEMRRLDSGHRRG